MPVILEHWPEEGQQTELPDDFLKWLNEFLPDWQDEYTGTIYGLYMAWEAGKKCQ